MMKKEKLEQMKEMGRGGFTKGMSFLRSSASAAITESTSNTTSNELTINDDGKNLTENIGNGGNTNISEGKKMTYDDLVSLSMKLTRQNKLMKAQYQKMQLQIKQLQAIEIDMYVLKRFITDTVGIDLGACRMDSSTLETTKKVEGPGTNETESGIGLEKQVSSIDEKHLEELYHSIEQIKEQQRKQVENQLRVEIEHLKEQNANPVSDNSFASFTSDYPLAVPMEINQKQDQNTGAAQLKQYDEIDLWGSATNDNATSQSQLTTKPTTDHFALITDFTTNDTSKMQIDAKILSLEKENLTLQEHLRDALKHNESANQSNSLSSSSSNEKVQILESQIIELEKKLHYSLYDNKEMKSNMNKYTALVDDMTQSIETSKAAEKSLLIEKEKLEHQLENMREEISEQSKRADQITNERNELVETVQELQKQLDSRNQDSVEVDDLRNSLVSLQDEIKVLKESEGMLLRKSKDQITAKKNNDVMPIDSVLEELEKVKMERAEMEHSLHSLKSSLTQMMEERKMFELEREKLQEVVRELDGKVSTLSTECKQLAEHNAQLESDKRSWIEVREKLEKARVNLAEELDVIRRDNQLNLENAVTENEEKIQQIDILTKERQELSNLVSKLNSEIEIFRERSDAMEHCLTQKEEQINKMASSQSKITTDSMALQKEIALMRDDMKLAADGLEAHAVRAEASELKVSKLQKEIEMLNETHIKSIEILKAKKDNELKMITSDLQTAKMELEESKKALSDRLAWATRLQTENMGIAQKHAEQAALIETALQNASRSQKAEEDMKAQVQNALEQLALVKRQNEEGIHERENMLKEMQVLKNAHAQAISNERKNNEKTLDDIKQSHKLALEKLEGEGKMKSKLALQVVHEKDQEIKRLSKHLAELEQDVNSGGAENRKILEFAQMQATREAENRAQAQRLEEVALQLEDLRNENNRIQQENIRLNELLANTMSSKRRDGVNMEYLKNVVVQYMTFPPKSPQQMRLIPVLSSLLEFTATEIMEVKKSAKEPRMSWSGSWRGDRTEYKTITPTSTRQNSISSSMVQQQNFTRSPSSDSIATPPFTLPNGKSIDSSGGTESTDF